MSFLLPSPRVTTLAGCMWLPRIIAKARCMKAGTLPPEYAERFGAANGTDGQFLGFFGLAKEDVLAACEKPDEEVAGWFLGREGIDEGRIAEWNELAVNLGRPGYPMAARLPVALATTYAGLDSTGLGSVFEVIEADEARG